VCPIVQAPLNPTLLDFSECLRRLPDLPAPGTEGRPCVEPAAPREETASAASASAADCGTSERSVIEIDRTLIQFVAGLLRQFDAADKRPTREQVRAVIHARYDISEVRFRFRIWPNACAVAGLSKWARAGRISDEKRVTESQAAMVYEAYLVRGF
jgi:hypothetical protein